MAGAVDMHTRRCGPGASAGCSAATKSHRQRREQRLDVALDVEEIDCALRHAPLLRVGRAVGQRGDAHRLVDAGDGHVAIGDRGIALNTRPTSKMRTRGARCARLWRSVATRLPIRLERITASGRRSG